MVISGQSQNSKIYTDIENQNAKATRLINYWQKLNVNLSPSKLSVVEKRTNIDIVIHVNWTMSEGTVRKNQNRKSV